MERGGEALNGRRRCKQAVIARLDRAIQYAVTSVL
jgi:hypothetical protein